MREAGFGELFRPAGEALPGRDRRLLDRLARWLFSWEDWLTFAIVLVVFLSVVGSIDNAHWVDDMPSLYPIALLGLLLGFFLARTGWPEALTHPIAFLLGSAGALWQVLAVVSGEGFRDRAGEMVERMDAWWDALLTGGISSDNLPFIVMVMALTWLAAYVSSWSVFRWHNPWLGLVPGGLALLMNISYLPGQFSLSFVVFLLGAILLIMRMHFTERMREWRRTGTPYPQSLHFFSLHQALWAALILLGAAWLMPPAGRTQAFESIWEPWAQPVADKMVELSRVFAAVEGKKGLPTHRFDSFLPFRGYVGKGTGQVLSVEAPRSGFLRGLVYDVYTSTGWKTGERDQQPLEERSTDISRMLEIAPQQYQQQVSVEIEVRQEIPVLLTLGQPLITDVPAEVETAADRLDIASLRPAAPLEEGDRYTATGLISLAPLDVLRASGSDYPSWVTERYLQLPEDLPPSVSALAQDLTRFDETPYEKARAIEDYLRTYPHEVEAPTPPAGRDAVDYFLFEQRRGHALYHASAMVVLLRTLGIPSRLAVGFVLEPRDRDPDSGAYQVSGVDAFAWPEVYFPGLGWIEFSPAPVQPLIFRPDEEIALPSSDEPSLEELLGLYAPLTTGETETTLEGGEEAALAAEERGIAAQVTLAVLAVIVVVVLASAAGVRYAWNRGLDGLGYPVQVWEKTVRLASWARMGPRPSQTPREFIGDLRQELPEVRDLPFLAASYERAQFGRKPLAEGDKGRLESLWRTLRSRLLSRILRWR
jgi:transglutaminase-like putative cysteine protease